MKSSESWPVIRVLHRLEDAALIVALLTMLVFALLQILLRNLMDGGILWAEPFLRILVLWVAILGAMVATRENNHISIDALSRYLSSRWRSVASVVTGSFASVVCLTVAWYSIELLRFEYEDATIAFASVPTWVCESIIPFGFLVMSIRFALHTVSTILGRRPQEAKP